MNEVREFPRFVASSLADALRDTPIVVVQGARQTGKSTLIQSMAARLPGAMLVTLDDPTTLQLARRDPAFFVSQSQGPLVIDEVQRAPELILPLKAAVDRDRRPGRFLLTGSADLLQVKGVGDSLAGRAETIPLKPLSQGELVWRSTPEDFVSWLWSGADGARLTGLDVEAVVTGGFPEVIKRDQVRGRAWLRNYVGRLADHDARELASRGFSDQLQTLLELLAATGQAEYVTARIARALGVSEPTADAYLRLARVMQLVEKTPAWTRSMRGRIVQRPKLSLLDSGLSSALASFTAAKANTLGGREYFGTLVEQFVTSELRKQQTWTTTPFRMFHVRDHDGLEVDLLLELDDGRLVAIEVKASLSPSASDWANLQKFRDRIRDRQVIGVCLHGGTQVGRMHDWLHVLPVTALWQH